MSVSTVSIYLSENQFIKKNKTAIMQNANMTSLHGQAYAKSALGL